MTARTDLGDNGASRMNCSSWRHDSSGWDWAASSAPQLVEHLDTASFKKIFAAVLVGLAVYLFKK